MGVTSSSPAAIVAKLALQMFPLKPLHLLPCAPWTTITVRPSRTAAALAACASVAVPAAVLVKLETCSCDSCTAQLITTQVVSLAG